MEALVFVLIILFFVVSEAKKKNRGAAPQKGPVPQKGAAPQMTAMQSRRAARQAAANQRAEQFRRKLDKAVERPRAEVKAFEEAFEPVEKKAAPAPAADIMQGASMLDEEGCVGGSMDHDHTEGERHEEHDRHMKAAKQRESQELLEQVAAQRQATVNAQALRRAVVMAEVLGKPRALRGYNAAARR